MTIEDALKANPVFKFVPDDIIEVAAVGRSVEITDDYDSSKTKDLELISADLYLTIATTPEFSEGDLSVKYDAELLKTRAANIYLKHQDEKASEFGFRKLELGITKL